MKMFPPMPGNIAGNIKQNLKLQDLGNQLYQGEDMAQQMIAKRNLAQPIMPNFDQPLSQKDTRKGYEIPLEGVQDLQELRTYLVTHGLLTKQICLDLPTLGSQGQHSMWCHTARRVNLFQIKNRQGVLLEHCTPCPQYESCIFVQFLLTLKLSSLKSKSMKSR